MKQWKLYCAEFSEPWFVCQPQTEESNRAWMNKQFQDTRIADSLERLSVTLQSPFFSCLPEAEKSTVVERFIVFLFFLFESHFQNKILLITRDINPSLWVLKAWRTFNSTILLVFKHFDDNSVTIQSEWWRTPFQIFLVARHQQHHHGWQWWGGEREYF